MPGVRGNSYRVRGLLTVDAGRNRSSRRHSLKVSARNWSPLPGKGRRSILQRGDQSLPQKWRETRTGLIEPKLTGRRDRALLDAIVNFNGTPDQLLHQAPPRSADHPNQAIPGPTPSPADQPSNQTHRPSQMNSTNRLMRAAVTRTCDRGDTHMAIVSTPGAVLQLIIQQACERGSYQLVIIRELNRGTDTMLSE